MRRGFLYLVAVMDWASRKVLSWRVSNTMDVAFCVDALEEAMALFGRPEIFNTDQGSQGGFKGSSQHSFESSEALRQAPQRDCAIPASCVVWH